jgi:hypothetical protein
VAISQVASNLFMRCINHWHLTFHKTLQSRVAETASQGKNVIYTFFLECMGE